ncbi:MULTISPECIES: chaperone modulator CbpM [unclassified Frankia]
MGRAAGSDPDPTVPTVPVTGITHLGGVEPGLDLLGLDSFCLRTRLGPDIVRRLVALGLLDVRVGQAGQWWLPVCAVGQAVRIERLRRDLGITYAATDVVLDLRDRIDELEQRIRGHRDGPGRAGPGEEYR